MEHEDWRKNVDQNIKSKTGRWELFLYQKELTKRTYTEGWKEKKDQTAKNIKLVCMNIQNLN